LVRHEDRSIRTFVVGVGGSRETSLSRFLESLDSAAAAQTQRMNQKPHPSIRRETLHVSRPVGDGVDLGGVGGLSTVYVGGAALSTGASDMVGGSKGGTVLLTVGLEASAVSDNISPDNEIQWPDARAQVLPIRYSTCPK
jgi:hypothetical protein